ncbi:MAG: type II secretion system major pseudopilin GspG [Phycisphaerae bacterium]|jgi:general secretion pathway protein G|nr:type II secretion system major pseudopilin GspG [Phycisphaerae bacterium]
MTRRNRKTRGFTLVEVLLVIAIVGILATVVAVNVIPQWSKSRVDTADIQIKMLAGELGKYNLNIGHYPTEDEGGLNALVTMPAFDDDSMAGKWAGPYITRKQLKDPWGNEISYQLVDQEQGDTTRQVLQVWSHGPNGEDDSGEGDDIKSWEDEEDGV